MKDRGGGEGGGGRGGRGGRGGGHKVKSRAALSLTAFAGAKKSGYDKLRAQQTQFNLNAKKVNKYRKWLAREGLGSREGGEEARDAAGENVRRAKPESEDGEQGGEKARPIPQKRKSALHRLHEKAQREKQAQQEEQQQRELERQEREKGKAAAAAARKSKAVTMRKRTRTGQPVMKHRIDSLLDKIQANT